MTKNNNICFNTNTTIQTHNVLYSWLNNINPQFFLSIQLPKHLRSVNLIKSNQNLKRIMIEFEQFSLKRHWNRKHIPFIAIAEHGKARTWHYHIYIYNCHFNFLTIQSIIKNVSTELNLPHEVLHIEPILTTGVYPYTSKEIIADINYHFDSDRIITSEYLFNLPPKSSMYIPQSQNRVQNHRK